MKTNAARYFMISAFLFVAGIASPGILCAQATPGPIAPATPKEPSPSAQPNDKSSLPPNTTLSGTWKLNTDDSDDGRKKLQQARSHSGGGHGGYPGGYPGGGMHGGGNGGGRLSEDDRDRLRELVDPASRLTLVRKDSELDLTDDMDRKRVFITDGRKPEKSKDDSYQEIPAQWKSGAIVSNEKDPRGGKLSRTFELGQEGHQLYETIRMNGARSGSTVVIRYVYDLVPPAKLEPAAQ
jgi:hypothetical protein